MAAAGPEQSQFMCPVCGYPSLREPAYSQPDCPSFDICPCCGTQFGYDDAGTPHSVLRQRWVAAGTPWYSKHTSLPPEWSGRRQLETAGFADAEGNLDSD